MSNSLKTNVFVTMIVAATAKAPSRAMVENRTAVDESRKTYESELMGYIEQSPKQPYQAIALIGGQEVHVGEMKTRKQAKHLVKRSYFAAKDESSLSIADAAAILSPNAKNPVSALKKKISRGSIDTVEVNGETRVIMPTA